LGWFINSGCSTAGAQHSESTIAMQITSAQFNPSFRVIAWAARIMQDARHRPPIATAP